jgi:hypothetical protein
MPQIEHDPSPTSQRAALKFNPVFKIKMLGRSGKLTPLFL